MYHRVTQDDFILDEVANRIAALNRDFIAYRPTLCVIATWSQAVLFSSDFLSTQVYPSEIMVRIITQQFGLCSKHSKL